MSALGQKQTRRHLKPMSALLPKADIGTQSWNVRFVPKADILHCGRSVRNFSAEAMALPLAPTFVGAVLQLLLQLLLLLLEHFRIGRRTVIGLAEIGERQDEADRLAGRVDRLNGESLPFLHLGDQVG